MGKSTSMIRGFAVLLASFVGSSSPAEEPPIVVVREPGRPQQRCVIEQTLPQPDGQTVYIVRDVATGERLRVVDNRPTRTGGGPLIGKLAARLTLPSDEGMSRALTSSPSQPAGRTPTTAELAGGDAAKAEGGLKPAGPKATPRETVSPVEAQLNQLRRAEAPSQRELAAMTLTLSEARTIPEVVQAITKAAHEDAASSVRAMCVRCLYRLSGDVPEVAAALVALTSDAVFEVAETARLALREIDRKKSPVGPK